MKVYLVRTSFDHGSLEEIEVEKVNEYFVWLTNTKRVPKKGAHERYFENHKEAKRYLALHYSIVASGYEDRIESLQIRLGKIKQKIKALQ